MQVLENKNLMCYILNLTLIMTPMAQSCKSISGVKASKNSSAAPADNQLYSNWDSNKTGNTLLFPIAAIYTQENSESCYFSPIDGYHDETLAIFKTTYWTEKMRQQAKKNFNNGIISYMSDENIKRCDETQNDKIRNAAISMLVPEQQSGPHGFALTIPAVFCGVGAIAGAVAGLVDKETKNYQTSIGLSFIPGIPNYLFLGKYAGSLFLGCGAISYILIRIALD